ncbi:MAG: hypothetical protein ACYTFZ_11510, partial [Planctomycetota bacterium]
MDDAGLVVLCGLLCGELVRLRLLNRLAGWVVGVSTGGQPPEVRAGQPCGSLGLHRHLCGTRLNVTGRVVDSIELVAQRLQVRLRALVVRLEPSRL